MSLFRDYFKNGLRWPLLAFGGALDALTSGAAGTLDTARDAVLWLREQFLPELCVENYVEAHARSRAVRKWCVLPVELREAAVRAYLFYKMGGRRSGLENVLQFFGIPGKVIEGDETNPPIPPYFFDILVETPPPWPPDEFMQIVLAFKPARSWISACRQELCPSYFVLDYSVLDRDCLSDVFGHLHDGVKYCFLNEYAARVLRPDPETLQGETRLRSFQVPVYTDWLDWMILDFDLPLLNPVGVRYVNRSLDAAAVENVCREDRWRTFKCQQVLDEWGSLSGGEGFIDVWEVPASWPDGFPVLSDAEPGETVPIIEFYWNDRASAMELIHGLAAGNSRETNALVSAEAAPDARYAVERSRGVGIAPICVVRWERSTC